MSFVPFLVPERFFNIVKSFSSCRFWCPGFVVCLSSFLSNDCPKLGVFEGQEKFYDCTVFSWNPVFSISHYDVSWSAVLSVAVDAASEADWVVWVFPIQERVREFHVGYDFVAV